MFLSKLVICIFHVNLPGCGCFCLPEMRNCHSYSSSWNHFLRKTSRRCVLGGNTKTKWAPNRYKHGFNFTVGVLTGLPFTRPLVGVISFNLKL